MNKIKEIWFIYRNKIVGCIILCLVGVIAFAGIYFFNVEKITANSIVFESTKDKIDNVNEKIEKTFKENESSAVDNLIKVDIKGEVKKPGVYEVEINKRISDVISLAGGVTSNADTSVTNLSKKVFDEMVIIVYSKKEVASFGETKKLESTNQTKCKNNEKLVNNSCVLTDSFSNNNNDLPNKTNIININTATIDDLMNLSGIGESKAKSIVEYRMKNGKFKKIEDILNVSGIGESLFEKIKSNITV